MLSHVDRRRWKFMTLFLTPSFDVAFFTETWLYSQGDEAYVAQMTP